MYRGLLIPRLLGLMGLSDDAYHYLNTGTDALAVRTNTGAISAQFLGDAGGATYDGKVIFYKNFDVRGSQVNSGNLTVSGNLINGTTNVLTSLNGKATITDLNLKAPIANPIFTGDVIIMETAVPGQIMHAFRQSDMSTIRNGLQVTGDMAATGVV